MKLTLDRPTLEKLLHHAASAAQFVGHLDDDNHSDLIDQLGDHVDAVVHGLTEILGAPRTLTEHDDVAPDDCAPHDGASALACGAGGGR